MCQPWGIADQVHLVVEAPVAFEVVPIPALGALGVWSLTTRSSRSGGALGEPRLADTPGTHRRNR